MNPPWRYDLLAILLAQSFVFGLKLNDGFYDGRRHVNWSAPFWMMKGEEMHKVHFWTDGAAGVVSKSVKDGAGHRPVEWYASHPQLIAIPIYLWTSLFGFAESSARSLPIFMTLLTTILLWLAVRVRHGERWATVFAGSWAALPATIVYGRSLEHEPLVMLFAALGALAQEKVFAGDSRWRWAWPVAMAGMMWSDWSGFVFVGLLFLAQAALARSHPPTRQLLPLTVLGGAGGLAIVIGQGVLTTTIETAVGAAPSPVDQPSAVRGVLGSFWNQYYNRSGRAGGAAWDYWLGKQTHYWSTNFTAILGVSGALAGAAAQARAWLDGRRDGGMSARAYFLLIAFGNLIYAVIVREATAVHIFYQYYYGAFVAWGLAEIVSAIANAPVLQRRRPALIATAAWSVMLAVLSASALKTLYMKEWGGPAEVKLLKLIKEYPNASAAMIASPEDNYLANPNVEYYAGQRIWMAYPEDAVRKDLVLLPPGDAAAQERALNLLAAPATFSLRACSPLLCLWVKTRA